MNHVCMNEYTVRNKQNKKQSVSKVPGDANAVFRFSDEVMF